MSWYSKEAAIPIENSPIDGLFFLHGDIVALTRNREWTKGMKSTAIEFPSGLVCALWGMEYALVSICDTLDVPLDETRDEAYITAIDWNEDSLYSVLKVGDTQLEVWEHQTESVYRLSYDNARQRLVDVARIG